LTTMTKRAPPNEDDAAVERQQRAMKTLASSTTETPISTSEPGALKTARAFGIFDEATDLTPEKFDAVVAAFDPAPGVDLSDAYADRMAVRVERDKIAEGEHLPTTAEPVLDQPGRQTSPELAALASKYISLDLSTLDAAVNQRIGAPSRMQIVEDVRRLAASVLSQVNG
jgi:hypothetical protein